MSIFIAIVTFIAGGAFGSFTLYNALLSVFFGIRFTKRLKRQGVLLDSRPFTRYSTSALVLFTTYGAILSSVWVFLPSVRWTFLFGTLFPVLLGLGQLGGNTSTIFEYVQRNRDSIAPDFVDLVENTTSGAGME